MGGTWSITPGWGRTFTFCIWGRRGRDLHEWANALRGLRAFDEFRLYKQQGQTKVHISNDLINVDSGPISQVLRKILSGTIKNPVSALDAIAEIWPSRAAVILVHVRFSGRSRFRWIVKLKR